MQSRMDRYNNIESTDTELRSRTKRNQGLYEKIKTSELKRYDVSDNMSVIDDNIKSVDITKINNFLDEKYGDNTPKRRTIDLPEIEEVQSQEPIMDTKEYDINAIIEKAKQGKNIDYSKERLKKVREAQYEILNNLDSELANLSSLDKAKEKRKKDEENLKELINTITEIELQNKMKDTSSDFDLLSDLMDDSDKEDKVDETKELTLNDSGPIDIQTIKIPDDLGKTEEVEEKALESAEENTEEIVDAKDETTTNIVIGGVQQEENTINAKIVEDIKEKNKEKNVDNPNIEKTLNKLNININSYDDFADINEKDGISTILKIVIFIVFIALIIGALYILNNLLGLGLLPF